ncbi:MAG: hypothetical protein WC070_00490 [Candidatus Magasanikbacteria bacterium]
MSSPEQQRGNQTPEKKGTLSVKEMIVNSGIAERMFESIKKHDTTTNPEITFDINRCDFRVQKFTLSADVGRRAQDETKIQVIIKMPSLQEKGIITEISFDYERNGHFGADVEPPLTPEQEGVIEAILKEQDKQTTSK